MVGRGAPLGQNIQRTSEFHAQKLRQNVSLSMIRQVLLYSVG